MTADALRCLANFSGTLVASLLPAVCVATGPRGSPDAEQPFETVLAATRSGLDQPRREVIRDAASWARLWAEIHARESPAPPLPPVDFERQMLIAVALGTRASGGFGIRVTSVVVRGDRLEVAVEESCPAKGAMLTLSLTQPVEVVRVAKAARAPAFRESRAATCPR